MFLDPPVALSELEERSRRINGGKGLNEREELLSTIDYRLTVAGGRKRRRRRRRKLSCLYISC